MFILRLPLINVRWLLVSWNGKLIFEWNIIEIHFQAANVTISQYLQSENITTVPCRQPAPNVFQPVATLWFFNILCLTWRQEPDQVLKSKTKMTEEGEEGDQEGTTDAPENSMLLFRKRKTNFALSCDQFQAMIDFLPKSSTRLFHFWWMQCCAVSCDDRTYSKKLFCI